MKGKYEVTIKNSRIQYKFAIERNITILRGDSAAGKTTLIDMVREYSELGSDSGIELMCQKKCVTLEGKNWDSLLDSIKDSIIFIDEGNSFVNSYDFAKAVRSSDNYFVIATRNNLPSLPYSVDEIYGLKNTTSRISKYQNIKRYYTHFKKIYGENLLREPVTPDHVIVEDSNSGYEFFKYVCDKYNIPCVSANGKSNVYKAALKAEGKKILVIADGAAFGAEIEKVLSLKKRKPIYVFLPESFEYLILDSGLTNDSEVAGILNEPSAYIDSLDYFSWERFFTALLISKTKNSYLNYSKSKLNPAYLNKREQKAILSAANAVIFDEE